MDGDICLGDTIASDEDLERDAIRRIDHECMKRELWLAWISSRIGCLLPFA